MKNKEKEKKIAVDSLLITGGVLALCVVSGVSAAGVAFAAFCFGVTCFAQGLKVKGG